MGGFPRLARWSHSVELMETEPLGQKSIRVLIADSSQIHTQLLADALKREPGLDVFCADCDSKALVATAAEQRADVVVINSHLDEEPLRGFEVLRELRALHPHIRGVMLLDSSKPEIVLHAFRVGARGIFSRHDAIESLCKCLRSVYAGQIWASSQEMSMAVEALASSPLVRAVDANGLELLSKREMEVVRCLAEGLTNREIAQRLGLSQHTIKNYLFRVFDKLGVANRVELLFMTLTQANPAQSLTSCLLTNPAHDNGATLAVCQKAAEQGLAPAQLVLAETYSARYSGSSDRVEAYMWYLIVGEQITRAKHQVSESMSMEQLLEAEHRAAEWMKNRKKPTSSAERLQEYRPKREKDASSRLMLKL